MAINRADAERRLQAALQAFRKVAEDRRKLAAAIVPPDLDPHCGYIGDNELEAIADGFDLMASIWTELEAMSREHPESDRGLRTVDYYSRRRALQAEQATPPPLPLRGVGGREDGTRNVYPCGCSRLKVEAGRCDIFAPDGSQRWPPKEGLETGRGHGVPLKR